MRRFLRRLSHWFRGDDPAADLNAELEFHRAETQARLEARGVPADEAAAESRRALGNVTLAREDARAVWGWRWMQSLAQDVRFGARLLRRNSGFAIAAVLSLALGIGANTAIFQLLDAVRLRPLPVERPRELVKIEIPARGWPPDNYSGRYGDLTYPIWERIRDRQQVFSGMLAWGQTNFDLSTRGESRFAENAIWVSGSFFDVLGVRAQFGRVFTAADDVQGCPAPGIVLSHTFWRREFSSSPSVVGSSLTLNGQPFHVIGVTPPDFFGIEVGRAFDLAVPLCAEAILRPDDNRLRAQAEWWLSVLGRLRPGVSRATADAQLASIAPAIVRETVPDSFNAEARSKYLGFSLATAPGASGFSAVRQQYDRSLWLLLGVAGTVLLIACANLANLLLARSSAREREIAVRLAMGASRGRLTRQLLVESLLLAALGAVAGAIVAPMLGRTIVGLISSAVSPLFLDLRLDWRVLAFATSLALGTCVLFGLAPARRASAVAPTTSLKNAARGLTKRGSTLRRALVVTQIALALALLSGGLLFARTLFNLLTIDAGFQSAGVLETDVDFDRLQLPPEERAPARRALLDRLQAIPGVRSAATTSTVPLVSNWQQAVYLDTPADPEKAFTRFNRVSARYFETMGTTIVSGRDFAAQDTPSSPRVAVVTEAFVRTFLHGRHAVGARFRVQGTPGRPDPTFEIVGVVADSKYETLRESPKPIVFLAESQLKAPGTWANVMIRSDVPIASLMAAVKQAVEADFPRLAFHFHDLEEQVEHSLLQERLMAVLCGFFAALAAVLATIGVYGVIAYSVAERTGEIGIRLVLGAGSREVLHLVLREAALMVTIGLIAGLGLALSLARFAGALLFGVEPQDPITLGAAIAILAVVAIAASYLPAWRASRLNPLAALRAE